MSALKKSGGLKRAMKVHYVPPLAGVVYTYCGRKAKSVFTTNVRCAKRVGCRQCLKAMCLRVPKRK